MKGTYFTSRSSRCWLLTNWFSLLIIGGINSKIIYTSNTNHKIPRKNFLKSLSISLTINYLKIRDKICYLPYTIILRITDIIGISKSTTSWSNRKMLQLWMNYIIVQLHYVVLNVKIIFVKST